MTTKKVKKELGKILKQRRQELGLNRYQMMKKLDQTNSGRIIAIEKGTSNYTIHSLIEYMIALEIEEDFINNIKNILSKKM